MGWHTGDDTWSGRRLARPALEDSATGTEIAERTAAGTGRSMVSLRRAEGERRSEEEGKEGGRLALCRKPPAREHSSGKYP